MSRGKPKGGVPMGREEAHHWLATLRDMTPGARVALIAALPEGAVLGLYEEWWWGALRGQREPAGDWRVWPVIAGRGFGKTRVGAEWVAQRARDHPEARIALVGGTLDEVVQVMIEGDSGLIAHARSDEKLRWVPNRRALFFPSGAIAFPYSAARPDKLRGPQHHFAWCDEIAKWKHADAAWDNLMLGLRLGTAPRTIVTTTPRPVPILKRILALPRSAPTHGRTDDNPYSAADYRAAVAEMYAGTRLGRQELDGVLFDDPEGALWTREMLENGRGAAPAALERVVVGVDPPVAAGGDACGILVCGLDGDGVCWVLADYSVAGLRPEGWARRAAAAAADWEAQLVIAEKNQGGDMVESVLRGVDAGLPVRLVSATRGKAARAEPVALRFETGRARLAGHFPELEDQLAAFTYQGYQGEGSPDRADAMVWAMTELLERAAAGPRIVML